MSTESATSGDNGKDLNNTNHFDDSPEQRSGRHLLICSTTPYNSPAAATIAGKKPKERKFKRFSFNEENKTYSKEEKTRQNEEIILESSSVSSETGSWESVFADKLSDYKEVCERFLACERKNALKPTMEPLSIKTIIPLQKIIVEEDHISPSHSNTEDKEEYEVDDTKASATIKTEIDKSTKNFFVDLSKLPDTVTPEEKKEDVAKEKKNMFSMFVDIGDKSRTTKDVPVRFSLKQKTKSKKELEQTQAVNKKRFSQKDTIIQEEPVTNSMDLFVKLSDLDKPLPKTTIHLIENERMVRSTPAKKDTIQAIGSRSMEVISSFHSANALSLSRIFPHLKDALFSKSMPTSLIINHSDDRYIPEGSELSSLTSLVSSQSSAGAVIDNSLIDKNDQPMNLAMNCPSQLGQDLLAMFLREIAPDVIVEVSGRRLRAHKCILSSRCPYFAGMLSGGWVESAGNVITLPHFAFGVAHFALCHIYSGVALIPDSVSIMELAAIAELLGLEGLKETIMAMLKTKYCHDFHEPCAVCVAGVVEVFPVTAVYGLDELYRRCLAWITRHFRHVWPTKAFSRLPAELLERCRQEHVVNLSVETVADTVYGCGVIVSSLGTSRWADVVVRMCRRLIDATAQFAAPRLCDVLRALRGAGAGSAAGADALHHCVLAAVEWAPPDQLCRAYHLLSALGKEPRWALAGRAAAWRVHCEGVLVRSAPRVVRTAAFEGLPAELRARLRELGCIAYGAPAATPASRARARAEPPAARALDMEHVRARFVPYAAEPPPARPARAAPAPARAPPSVRTTRAQEERARFNLIKTNQSSERLAPRPARSAYERTEPRYMRPRRPEEKRPQKPRPPAASSSDSSRNSSPAVRGARPRLARAPPAPPAPADTHSLNKYATYTKDKYKAEERVNAQVEKSRSTSAAPATARSHMVIPKNTKIPVYQNVQRRVQKPNGNEPRERKPSGSHMNATKASNAKKVSKVTPSKESARDRERSAALKSDNSATNSYNDALSPDIPVMERSGTFLKEKADSYDTLSNQQ